MIRSSELTAFALAASTAVASARAGDPAHFVPPDTVLFARAASLDELNIQVRAVLAAVDGLRESNFDARSLVLGEFEGELDPKLIDARRPIAWVVSLAKDTHRPILTTIVPAASHEELVNALSRSPRQVEVESDGDYVAWHEGKFVQPMLSRAIHPLADGLPAGVFALRVDAAKWIAGERMSIDGFLDSASTWLDLIAVVEQKPGIDLRPTFAGLAIALRAVVDSAEGIELAFDVKDARLDLAARLTVRAGSSLDGFADAQTIEPTALARLASNDDAFTFIVGGNLARLLARAKPTFSEFGNSFPPPIEALVDSARRETDAIASALGKTAAISIDRASRALRMTALTPSSDPGALGAIARKVLAAPELERCGVQVVGPSSRERAGAKLAEFELRLSDVALRAIYRMTAADPDVISMRAELVKRNGRDGWRVALATEPGIFAAVVGGDDAYLEGTLSRAASSRSASGAWSTRWARSIGRVSGESPCFVARIDAEALLEELELPGSILRATAPTSGSTSTGGCTLDLYGGVRERTWSGGLSIELSELAALSKALAGERAVRERTERVHADLALLEDAIDHHRRQFGRLPSELAELVRPDANGNTRGFIESGVLPRDPWGRGYVYMTDGRNHIVLCYGSDGKPGGVGEAADLDTDSLQPWK